MGAKELCERVLDAADVKVNGDRPWDIHIHDAGFYERVVGDGTLRLGESYVDGWWDCDALDEMMARALRAGGGSGDRGSAPRGRAAGRHAGRPDRGHRRRAPGHARHAESPAFRRRGH